MARMKTGRKGGPTLKNCILTSEDGKKRVLGPEECRRMEKKMFGKSGITDEQVNYAKVNKVKAKMEKKLRDEELAMRKKKAAKN